MSRTVEDKSCGRNGYVCPMCPSGYCPGCAHAQDDHVAKDVLEPAVLTCSGIFVDPVTGTESFCDCVQVAVP